jgi:hypothetical protein
LERNKQSLSCLDATVWLLKTKTLQGIKGKISKMQTQSTLDSIATYDRDREIDTIVDGIEAIPYA